MGYNDKDILRILDAYLEGALGDKLLDTSDQYLLGYLTAIRNVSRLLDSLEKNTYPDYPETN